MFITSVAPVTTQHYYSITDYSLLSVPFIRVTYSFCNWKTLSHSSSPISPYPEALPSGNQSALCLWASFCFLFCCCCFLLDSTWVKSHGICLFQSDFFIRIPSRSFQVVINDESSFFFFLCQCNLFCIGKTQNSTKNNIERINGFSQVAEYKN